MYIKGHSGFILTVYMVYLFLMSMQLTQRKIHTDTFLLIFIWFSIWLKFWKAETQDFPTIPSDAMYVEACLRCGKKLKIRAVMLCILMLKVSKEAQNGLILSFFWHLWHTYIPLHPLQCILSFFWHLKHR